jgi:transposase
LGAIEFSVFEATEGVAFCGRVMPEYGMGLGVELGEDRVRGFAGRLEVIEGPSGRRNWPDVVKAQIVQESLEPGVTVSGVVRRHRVSP